MHGPEERTRRVTLSLVVGVILLLIYALPVFVPPPPRWIVPASVDTPFLTRMFPHVPGTWVVGRLLALVAGALLVARAARDRAIRCPPALQRSATDSNPTALRLALLAAVIHVA